MNKPILRGLLYIMLKIVGKKILKILGIEISRLYKFYYEGIGRWSIKASIRENRYWDSLERLRKIVPDISNQEESEKGRFNDYWELKRRALQAFHI